MALNYLPNFTWPQEYIFGCSLRVSGQLYEREVKVKSFSCVQLFATMWTKACQAPLSMGFSKQEYWSKLPLSPLRDLSYPGIESEFLASPALEGRFFTTALPGKPYKSCCWCLLFLFAETLLPRNFRFPLSGCSCCHGSCYNGPTCAQILYLAEESQESSKGELGPSESGLQTKLCFIWLLAG